MPYSTCNPLTKLRLPWLWKESAIIIAWSSRVGTVLIRSRTISLLSDVYQDQQSRGQAEYDKAFQDTLVDIHLQFIIIAVVVAVILRIRIRPQELIAFFGSLLVQLGPIQGFFFLIILNECRNPFLECPSRFRVWNDN